MINYNNQTHSVFIGIYQKLICNTFHTEFPLQNHEHGTSTHPCEKMTSKSTYLSLFGVILIMCVWSAGTRIIGLQCENCYTHFNVSLGFNCFLIFMLVGEKILYLRIFIYHRSSTVISDLVIIKFSSYFIIKYHFVCWSWSRCNLAVLMRSRKSETAVYIARLRRIQR